MSIRVGPESDLRHKDKELIQEPDLYKVILHNDHYTTMDFVVEILMTVFRKTRLESEQLMLKIHKSGGAVVGIYSYDIARTKVVQVMTKARKEQFPLRCTMEKE